MADKYEALREAAEKATPGEWSVGPAHTDDEGYIELPIYSVVNGKKVAPMAIALQFPYVRGMQEANADLVVLAHNLMPALLAERDALRDALTEAARVIALDRQSLILCHESPKTGEIEDGLGREGLREYDHALELARTALAQ